MTYKEVQELRPGPYIIYFHPDKHKGYGVYRKKRVYNRVKEQGLDEALTKIIEEHTCILKASERERELQLRDGYEPDIVLYWQTLLRGIYGARACKGKKKVFSQETKNKLSETHKKLIPFRSKKHTMLLQQHRDNRKKKINKYSLDGDFIESYESIRLAGKLNKIPTTQIKDNCSGRQKTCRGFIWKYA